MRSECLLIVMRSMINVCSYVVGILFTTIGVLVIGVGLSYVGPRTEAVAAETAPGMVSPFARLDTSQIDDLRTPWVCPADQELVLWPEGAVRKTTPMVPAPGTCYVVPEESPDGGYPLPHSAWLDNSPLYSDGWLLLVDDMQHVVRWRKTTDEVIADHEPRELAAVQTVAHHRKVPGKPHHKTRCTAGKVRAEDGSCVPRKFYRHTPITGASQAICDALHKTRVPHKRWGHVCV